MKHPHTFVIAAGLAAGILFSALCNTFPGASFLMLFLSGAGFFLALLGCLWIPFQGRGAQKAAKFTRRVLCALLALGILSFALVEALIYAHGQGDADAKERDFIIVLGAGLYGETPSATLLSRLDAAFALLTENKDAVAVLSGGRGPGETIPEALAMKRYLVFRGIPEERLFMEAGSSSTEENLRFSLAMLSEMTEERPVRATVVSNDFHLYRAKRLAESLGLDVKTHGVPVPRIGLMPLSLWVREYFSVMLAFAKSIF